MGRSPRLVIAQSPDGSTFPVPFASRWHIGAAAPPMTPNPNPQTPAPVRRRWRWGRVVLLVIVAGFGALAWNQYTWHRAVRQLEAAGIGEVPQGDSVGKRLQWAARNDWSRFLDPGVWTGEPPVWASDSAKAENLLNLDALATALRRINPETLYLSGVTALENVDGLKGITALRQLFLINCRALQNVDGLEDLMALENLIISDCRALRKVDGLKRLTALHTLELSDCPALVNTDAFKGLTLLWALDLSGCTALENVGGLKGLTLLSHLRLDGCPALKSVEPVKGLSALEHVNLTGCTKLPLEEVEALKAALPKARIDGP